MSLRGRIMVALLSEAKPASFLAYQLEEGRGVVLANLYRLYHLGITERVLIGSNLSGEREIYWGLTGHAVNHPQMEENCLGCRMRMIYLTANEVVHE